jgi:acetyl-CoA carboxylase biotin carboxyl carrier protein
VSELNDKDVEAILRLFEDSDFDYLDFQHGDLKLTVAKRGYHPSENKANFAGSSHVYRMERNDRGDVVEEPVRFTENTVQQESSLPKMGSHSDLVAVTSPIVGTFYAAPDPQSDPYVTKGAQIEMGSTLGLVEVMKVYTTVEASVSGTIAEIVASNATLVEPGDVLFYIKPSG